MADTAGLGLTDAAQVLQELGICKAFGPTGKINAPNCQRFGHRDSSSGRWSWRLDDLIAEARKRQSASEQVIATVSFRYISTEPKPKPKILIPTERVNRSRAELEMTFRQSFLQLESALRNRLKSEGSLRDRRTLGNLICEAEKAGLFSAVQIAEAWFVNAARNSLSHPGLGEVSHSSLTRATQAATELSKQLS